MFSLKQAIVLALVGSTYASPIAHWGGRHRQSEDGPIGGRIPGTQGWDGKYVVVVGTTTDKDSSTPVNAAPATTTTVVVNSGNTGSTGSTPSNPSTGSTGSTGASSGSDTGYMATVNKWRSTMGRPTLSQSSKLEANALKTANDGNGQMVHELNPGSFGQVLAPGNANNFESVFVGGWLCEVPSLPGLSSVCGSMSKGWSHDGQTGHADILSSTKYTNIGCALAKGIWACDVS